MDKKREHIVIAPEEVEVSIVMPCLNEEKTVGICVQKALNFLKEHNIKGEVIVADNGSSDNSRDEAIKAGARVVLVPERGYGNALMGGIESARGEYIIIGDSDNSYDFSDLMPFVTKLREGYELVVGNRFKGRIEPRAMPFLHKYIGNPFLSNIGKLFFKSTIRDFHSGLRAFTKSAYQKMGLRTSGMEFASEMIVKATLFSLKTTEIPIVLSRDGREGRSHLRSFSDGWRHLKFLLLYSPRWLFFYPGLVMATLGLLLFVWVALRPDLKLDVHTQLYALASVLTGVQVVIFSIFVKTFAINEKLMPSTPKIEKILQKFTIEKGIVVGIVLFLIGLGIAIYTVYIWFEGSFFKLGITITLRYVIASVLFIALGIQIFFSSFFFGLLQVKLKK